MTTSSLAWPARRWAEPAARVGYTAKGIVYVMVGALAVRASLGWGGRATDPHGALETMDRQRFGDVLLALAAVGLSAYVFWRVTQAVLDLDRKGAGVKGLLLRAGFLGSGLAYASLALTAAAMAVGGRGDRRDLVRTWTTRALADPDRWWLVAAIGLGVLIGGLYQFYKAWSARFERDLRLSEVSAASRRWVRRTGRIGFVARGVTFAVIGWFLIRAGQHVNPGEARGLGGALRYLRAQEYGPWLLAGAGMGLIAYGLFSMVEGRYRRIG